MTATLTHGPVTQYGAIYDQTDGHTTCARYASGTVAEWFGPFRCELVKPLHLKGTYGEFDASREVHMTAGHVFVTRYTARNADGTDKVEYHVLNRYGIRHDVPADRASEFLRCARDGGQLQFCDADAEYQAAAERYAVMTSR